MGEWKLLTEGGGKVPMEFKGRSCLAYLVFRKRQKKGEENEKVWKKFQGWASKCQSVGDFVAQASGLRPFKDKPAGKCVPRCRRRWRRALAENGVPRWGNKLEGKSGLCAVDWWVGWEHVDDGHWPSKNN